VETEFVNKVGDCKTSDNKNQSKTAIIPGAAMQEETDKLDQLHPKLWGNFSGKIVRASFTAG
jgi:hypothetical protein